MDRVRLKHTELEVSRLCLGTMTFGGAAHETESRRILDLAIDSGINFIDTANVYNQGITESLLGQMLAGRRQNVVLATKVCGKMGEQPHERGLSREAICHAAEESLRRLRTDYLDIYYLHQPDWNTPIEETLEAMEMLVRQGKVRYPGSSNYAAWQVAEMQLLAAKNGYRPATITQPMYNLLARGIEQEYLAMAQKYGLSLIVYNPLAGGLLTGKQKRERPLRGTRFDGNQMYLDRYWHDDMFDAVEAFATLAAQEGRSLVSLALTWLLAHTSIDCVILGATKAEQLRENLLAAEDGPLSDNSLRACDVIWYALRGPTPKYNR